MTKDEAWETAVSKYRTKTVYVDIYLEESKYSIEMFPKFFKEKDVIYDRDEWRFSFHRAGGNFVRLHFTNDRLEKLSRWRKFSLLV